MLTVVARLSARYRPVPLDVSPTLFIMIRFGKMMVMSIGINVYQRVRVGLWSILFPMDPADRRATHLVAKGIAYQLIVRRTTTTNKKKITCHNNLNLI